MNEPARTPDPAPAGPDPAPAEPAKAASAKPGTASPRELNPAAVRQGPPWLRFVFLGAWGAFILYLAFLALFKTDRNFRAKNPFENDGMSLFKGNRPAAVEEERK